MLRNTSVTFAAVILSGAVISAQIVQRMPASGPPTVISRATTKATQVGQSVIHGTAVDADASPLPSASVRLRNLLTNEVEKTSTADRYGEFTFFVQPEIPYVVEIADQTGRVIAVGNVVAAQAGEVAASVVPVPLRLPALAGVFGNTAGSVVSSAAGTGLTALEANRAPAVSPDR